MSALMAFLKNRLHPILLEIEVELEEVRERILIVRVDGHPLRRLVCRVDCGRSNGDFAFQMVADSVQHQAEPLAGFLVLGPVVVMPGTFLVWSVGLEGVSSPVGEEAKVVRPHAGERI
jgi:hypothetical protein